MPSFSCDGCGDIIKKPKLDAHQSRCRHALFTCLDCQTTFHGFDYRKHTTCITEAQKYHGASAKAAKPSRQQSRHQAYVEDAAIESPAVPPRPEQAVIKVVPPPPAPSPPPTNVDVWDYLAASDTPAAGAKRAEGRAHQNGDFSYGDGPVAVGRDGSEKKRKRHRPEDHTPTAHNQHGLHTGLTGGLDRLLEPQSAHAVGASPLSPKKQSLRSVQHSEAERPESEGRALKRRQKHKAIEGSKELMAVTKSGSLSARETSSQSEMFVGLIDKPHSSSKGESIWSLLKRFDELGPRSDGDHKRLFSGLRVKQGKDGGFVLFTRKDKEME